MSYSLGCRSFTDTLMMLVWSTSTFLSLENETVCTLEHSSIS